MHGRVRENWAQRWGRNLLQPWIGRFGSKDCGFDGWRRPCEMLHESPELAWFRLVHLGCGPRLRDSSPQIFVDLCRGFVHCQSGPILALASVGIRNVHRRCHEACFLFVFPWRWMCWPSLKKREKKMSKSIFDQVLFCLLRCWGCEGRKNVHAYMGQVRISGETPQNGNVSNRCMNVSNVNMGMKPSKGLCTCWHEDVVLECGVSQKWRICLCQLECVSSRVARMDGLERETCVQFMITIWFSAEALVQATPKQLLYSAPMDAFSRPIASPLIRIWNLKKVSQSQRNLLSTQRLIRRTDWTKRGTPACYNLEWSGPELQSERGNRGRESRQRVEAGNRTCFFTSLELFAQIDIVKR